MAEAAAAKARRPTRALGCILQELEAEKAGQDMLLFRKIQSNGSGRPFIAVLVFPSIIPALPFSLVPRAPETRIELYPLLIKRGPSEWIV
jgi:hypothetical protein